MADYQPVGGKGTSVFYPLPRHLLYPGQCRMCDAPIDQAEKPWAKYCDGNNGCKRKVR